MGKTPKIPMKARGVNTNKAFDKKKPLGTLVDQVAQANKKGTRVTSGVNRQVNTPKAAKTRRAGMTQRQSLRDRLGSRLVAEQPHSPEKLKKIRKKILH
jgi:Tfp pilus assembly protein FimT